MSQTHQLQARADFERARREAAFHAALATLANRPNDLLSYHEVRRAIGPAAERYRGVRAVPVERIVGSLDRVGDFDRAFRPRRADVAVRWQRIACAHHEGTGLPAVRLYQLGDDYFVEDGHHRVSVARALGQGFVDAEVVEVAPRAAASTPPCPCPDRGGRRRPRLAAAWEALFASGHGGAQECAA